MTRFETIVFIAGCVSTCCTVAGHLPGIRGVRLGAILRTLGYDLAGFVDIFTSHPEIVVTREQINSLLTGSVELTPPQRELIEKLLGKDSYR